MGVHSHRRARGMGPLSRGVQRDRRRADRRRRQDRKSTRLNSSHLVISYAVFCLKKKRCATVDMHDELWYGCRGREEGSWRVSSLRKGRYRLLTLLNANAQRTMPNRLGSRLNAEL